MSQDRKDKHNALEEFLEDSLNESEEEKSAGIPHQTFSQSKPSKTPEINETEKDDIPEPTKPPGHLPDLRRRRTS